MLRSVAGALTFSMLSTFQPAPNASSQTPPDGIWVGTSVLTGREGVTDPDCTPNWYEKVGASKQLLLSFEPSAGIANLAVLEDYDVNSYSLDSTAGAITLRKMPVAGTWAHAAKCTLSLEQQSVVGTAEGGVFNGRLTQQWSREELPRDVISVHYGITLRPVTTGSHPLLGVWTGTPQLQTVESENKCLARTHAQWGHAENPAVIWIRGTPAALKLDVLDFLAHDDCPYTGAVANDGSFQFVSEERGSCGGGTGVDACGPNTGFQLTTKRFRGALQDGRLTGQMVETWTLHEAPRTTIAVTYQFEFERARSGAAGALKQ